MPITPEKRMDLLVSLCKRRGFVYPDSEIYGGFANAWDYGPYGLELKNNIRDAWWRRFVHGRDDVVGIDTPIIQHPKVWEASGHLQNFSDPLTECKKCHSRFRADQIFDMPTAQNPVTGPSNTPECPKCHAREWVVPKDFNLMFQTQVGVTQDSSATAYLRPETAAGMFTAWINVRDTMRKKLPFGIAQVGKSFRNEITPGNFIFRTREFEQMEIEYYTKPTEAPRMFDHWLDEQKAFLFDTLKIDPGHLVFHEIPDTERAFYSARTVDTEYQYPFGLKELHGIANRGDYDLSQHAKFSGEELRYLDPETNERYLPHVIEPSWGLTRLLLAVLLEHLDIDEAPTTEKGGEEERMVLRLPPSLAPVKAAVLPLQKKDGLAELGRDLAKQLRQSGLVTEYDESGSIGKRYRRQDEIGTPFCFTVDYQTKEDQTVTVRDRDSMSQERVAIADVANWVKEKI